MLLTQNKTSNGLPLWQPLTKKNDFYYDFGTGVKVPTESNELYKTITAKQETPKTETYSLRNSAAPSKTTRQDSIYPDIENEEEEDDFLKGFNAEDREEEAEREKFSMLASTSNKPPFLNAMQTFQTAMKQTSKPKEKVYVQDDEDDFLAGFNSESQEKQEEKGKSRKSLAESSKQPSFLDGIQVFNDFLKQASEPKEKVYVWDNGEKPGKAYKGKPGEEALKAFNAERQREKAAKERVREIMEQESKRTPFSRSLQMFEDVARQTSRQKEVDEETLPKIFLGGERDKREGTLRDFLEGFAEDLYEEQAKQRQEEEKIRERYSEISTRAEFDNFIELERNHAYEKAKEAYINNAIAEGEDPESFWVQQEAEKAAAVAAKEAAEKLEKQKIAIFGKSGFQKTLDGASAALTAASLVPIIDTAADLIQAPIDLLRGDYLGAGLDLVGAIPYYGEPADAAKTALLAAEMAGTAKAFEKADDVIDTAKAAKASTKISSKLDDLGGFGDDAIEAAQVYVRKIRDEGYSLAQHLDEAEDSVAELSKHAGYIAETSPIPIPRDVTVKIQPKNGYHNIEYDWYDATNGYIYEIRWHTKTPGAPSYQGDSWVVERRIRGISHGKNLVQPEHKVLLDDGRWVDWEKWRAAWRSKNRTPEQEELLRKGHIKPTMERKW